MLKLKFMLTAVLVLLGLNLAFAQSKEVTGVVIGASDQLPLIGASVVVSQNGKTITGTITDINGDFKLKVPKGTKSIIVSSIGYNDKTVELTGKPLKVVLTVSKRQLRNAIVVAYGEQTKNSFTGSAAQVSRKELTVAPVTSVINAVRGKVAGVSVDLPSGVPGASSGISIRGAGSINASTSPLYIVDGVPYGLSMRGIDPNDIASFTILKDASAVALFGSRGANGVVLITTRSGSAGKVRVSAGISGSVQVRLIPNYDLIRDPKTYIELSYQGLSNAYHTRFLGQQASLGATLAANAEETGIAPPTPGDLLFGSKYGIPTMYNMWNLPGDQLINPETGKFNPNAIQKLHYTSWKDALFRTGLGTNMNVDLSGGNKVVSFFTSLAYQKTRGYLVGTDYDRFSVRNNLKIRINKHLSLSSRTAFYRLKQNLGAYNQGGDNDPFNFYNNIPPIYPPYRWDVKTGKRLRNPYNTKQYLPDFGQTSDNDASQNRPFSYGLNPLGLIYLSKSESTDYGLTSNFSLVYDFNEDLKFTMNYAANGSLSISNSLDNPYFGDSKGRGDVAADYYTSLSQTLNEILSWQHRYGEHYFNVFVAHEAQLINSREISGSKHQVVTGEGNYLSNAIVMDNIAESPSYWALESYFGQARYELKDTYFFSASARADGSSKFAPGHRWGVFGSLGFAWLLSNESFLRNVSWLTNLKLKASVGRLGNSSIPSFSYVDTYSVSNENDKIGINFSKKGNPKISWEHDNMLNVGLEGSVLNDKFTWDVEAYYKRISNLLFSLKTAPSLGFGSIPYNDCLMSVKGLDLQFSYTPIRTQDMQLTFNVNGSVSRRILLRLPIDPATGKPKKYDPQGSTVWQKNHRLDEWYMRKYTGVNDKGQPTWLEYYTKDASGNEVPVKDLTAYLYDNHLESAQSLLKKTTTSYKSATHILTGRFGAPDLEGGFGWNFSYKNFSWSTTFTYGIGGYGYDGAYARYMESNGVVGKFAFHKDMLKSWTPTNKSKTIPMYTAGQDEQISEYANGTSTRFLIRNDYLNLAEMKLSYTLPRSCSRAMGISQTSIYVSGQNLMLLSWRRGYNPIGYIGSKSYKPLSTITLGLNLNF